MALFVAIVVAASESILYLIWQSRLAKRSEGIRTRRRIRSSRHKKDDGDGTLAQDKVSTRVAELEVMDERLRRRQ